MMRTGKVPWWHFRNQCAHCHNCKGQLLDSSHVFILWYMYGASMFNNQSIIHCMKKKAALSGPALAMTFGILIIEFVGIPGDIVTQDSMLRASSTVLPWVFQRRTCLRNFGRLWMSGSRKMCLLLSPQCESARIPRMPRSLPKRQRPLQPRSERVADFPSPCSCLKRLENDFEKFLEEPSLQNYACCMLQFVCFDLEDRIEAGPGHNGSFGDAVMLRCCLRPFNSFLVILIHLNSSQFISIHPNSVCHHLIQKPLLDDIFQTKLESIFAVNMGGHECQHCGQKS